MACSLGGTPFNPLAPSSQPVNFGSTGATGRHGSSNLWRKWPKLPASNGISGRAPYDQGKLKLAPSVGGGTNHNVGAGLGPHGHGIGTVPAAIGGAHNPNNTVALRFRAKSGGLVLQPQQGFCLKCFSTWLIAGAAILALALLSGSR